MSNTPFKVPPTKRRRCLKGKVALITGGGQGIGRAITLTFAQEGADVIVLDRLAAEMEKVVSDVREMGSKGVGILVDLSRREAISTALDKIVTNFPSIHILVNNAGVGGGPNPKMIIDYEDGFWEESIFVNLTVPYLLIKAILPKMLRQGWGRIINIASTFGKIGLKSGAAYSSSKHGLIGLTKTAALETATTGITVNAICPGATRTQLFAKRAQFLAQSEGRTIEEIEKARNPIQRLIEPEEIASLALYLASEEAGGLTGQSLNMCGGSIMF